MNVGPASKTQMILEGDILQDVDGRSVVMRPLSEISWMMLGPRGSQSDFGFIRKGNRFVVRITRQPMQDLRELSKTAESDSLQEFTPPPLEA